jgi:hypothetical protein
MYKAIIVVTFGAEYTKYKNIEDTKKLIMKLIPDEYSYALHNTTKWPTGEFAGFQLLVYVEAKNQDDSEVCEWNINCLAYKISIKSGLILESMNFNVYWRYIE